MLDLAPTLARVSAYTNTYDKVQGIHIEIILPCQRGKIHQASYGL